METLSLASFIACLRRHRLLEEAQLAEVTQHLQSRFPQPRELARELLTRGWLTPYQVNQLLQGRADDLVLDAYVLLERLGEGGMGQVFRARHQHLGRIVALKLIRKERLTNLDAVRRFQREIRVAAQLHHPNIVRAFDAAEVDGTYLLVMELVEGGMDLARLVQVQGPLPVADACAYIRDASLGLQHALERGLVHRDIKPHNLLLANGVVKILDLGLARLGHDQEEAGDNSTTLTRQGAVMGTLDYIAPEQARDSHAVDIRADLYSLGCTLYFLLTGQVPFPGGEAVAKLLRHHTEEPVPVEGLRPDVPPALAAVVRRLMAKRPEDRYQTPRELAELLNHLPQEATVAAGGGAGTTFVSTKVEAKPAPEPGRTEIAARQWADVVKGSNPTPPGSRPPAGPPIRRRRLYAMGLGVGGLLLLLLLVLGLMSWPSPPDTSTNDPKSKRPTVVLVNPAKTAPVEGPRPGTFTQPHDPPAQNVKPGRDPAGKEPPRASAPFNTKKAQEYQRLWAEHLGRTVEETNSVGMKLRLIPPGKFLMGSPPRTPGSLAHERPRHPVAISRPFYLGAHEVTQEQYDKVTGQNPSKSVRQPSHPVESVTWLEADAFCKQLSELPAEKAAGRSYRLPTEAEWEYACRAGTTTAYNVGAALAPRQAHFAADGRPLKGTAPVGSYPANAWGLFDMHGNVWEWCADWFDAKYYASSPKKDPEGPAQGSARLTRGGGWFRDANACRSAFREAWAVTSRFNNTGLRVLMELPATTTVPAPPLAPTEVQKIPAALLAGEAWGRFAPGTWVKRRIRITGQPDAELKETLKENPGGKLVVERRHKDWTKPVLVPMTPSEYIVGLDADQKRFQESKTTITRVREEILTIAGKGIPTRVVDFTTDLQQPGKKIVTINLWYAREVPGAVCRVVIVVDKIRVETDLVDFAVMPSSPDSPPMPPAAVAPFDTQKAREHQRLWAVYLGCPVEETNRIGMKLALIPPGRFFMGSPSDENGRDTDEARHEVTITKPFLLGVHEVTVGQFQKFVTATGYRTEADKDGKVKRHGNHARLGKPNFAQTEDHPVVSVSWEDARAFCVWLGQQEGRAYVLPTEAQWEYACRAGTQSRFFFGDDARELGEYAWYAANAQQQTHPVGQKKANPWGLFDMHGNAWEWTSSWWVGAYDLNAPREDPPGPGPGSWHQRVCRGGAWTELERFCRSAYRNGYRQPREVHANTGFRVVRAISERKP